MALPFTRQFPRKSCAVARDEDAVHPSKCLPRLAVNARACDDDQSPALVVESLPTLDVDPPLRVFHVLTPVVLNHDLKRRIAQVEPHDHDSVLVPNLEVDLRLWKTCEHDQHPHAGFHGRVHFFTYEVRRTSCQCGVMAAVVHAKVDEFTCSYVELADQGVADNHEIDERKAPGEFHEHLARRGHAEPVV